MRWFGRGESGRPPVSSSFWKATPLLLLMPEQHPAPRDLWKELSDWWHSQWVADAAKSAPPPPAIPAGPTPSAASGTASADWRTVLNAEEYHVLRERGTEAEGSGEYDRFYPVEGYFTCRGCGNPLFSAQSKFKSGCGWPSFDRCYMGSIAVQADLSHGDRRIELVCIECGGHLGHLFTGEHLTEMNQRHCVNSLSIRFVKQAPPAHLAERGESKINTAVVDRVLATSTTSTDGKLANVRPQSDLDLSDAALGSEWAATRAEARGWLVCSYAPDSKTRIVPIARGDAGYAQLRAALSEDLVNYGVLSAEVDGRRRHVFFCYVGSSTSALKRGRASMHAPHLEKFFDGTVGSLPTLTSPDELDETHVSGLLRQVCKGATTVEVS